MDTLADIFGKRIANGLHRGGIGDFTDLILEWPNIEKDFGGLRFRNIGKASYEFIEYFLKVELP